MMDILEATDDEINVAIRSLLKDHDEFSTIDIIRKITGDYQCNTGISVALSANAQFGKRLSIDTDTFGIRRAHPPSRSSNDDLGNSTTTAVWRRA